MADFKVGDRVRIKSGPFASFTSVVESVDAAAEVLVARVKIFGRATPIEIAFSEVEKVAPGGEQERRRADLN